MAQNHFAFELDVVFLSGFAQLLFFGSLCLLLALFAPLTHRLISSFLFSPLLSQILVLIIVLLDFSFLFLCWVLFESLDFLFRGSDGLGLRLGCCLGLHFHLLP